MLATAPRCKYHCLPCWLHIQLYRFHTLHFPCKVDYQTRRRLHLFAYHQLPFAKFLPESLPSFRSQQADSIDSYVRYLCSNQLPFSALFLTEEVKCYSLLSPRRSLFSWKELFLFTKRSSSINRHIAKAVNYLSYFQLLSLKILSFQDFEKLQIGVWKIIT